MNNTNKPERLGGSAKNRGAAQRAQRRNIDDAQRIVNQHAHAADRPVAKRANKVVDTNNKLKVTFLGGLQNVGEKNMAVIEYGQDAIILDCGNNLSIDLPGVNYEVNDTAYLATIKHKIKAYVITHGHLDHMGGLKHTVPDYPAPIFGSAFTLDVIRKSFDDLPTGSLAVAPQFVSVDIDSHKPETIGAFSVEYIRVTHSLPDAAAVCITTPVGRIVATGDFRLDPEPLDRKPTDTQRLRELGEQGVLLLLSESSYADAEGRVPTESTLQQSFYDIIDEAPGRIFVAAFSSNMNRAQMIINAAVASGRNVALDGRGMLSYAEIAVRQGLLKVPKGTIIPINQAGSLPANQLLVMCTGGQGEPNAALQRMSEGQHRNVNLEAGDTIVVSSSPIPGNEVRYDALSNRLIQKGVRLFRHPTHQLDGCGPLHVSGHAKRDELREMLQMIKPKFFIPVHGGALRRNYHAELGIQEGVPRQNVLLPVNGDSYFFTTTAVESAPAVPYGSTLIDQNGNTVPGVVVKDRVMLSQTGIVTVVLSIDKKSGQLVSSPDILSRGFIAMRDNNEMVNMLRDELRRAVQQRFRRIDLDRFKNELRDHLAQIIYAETGSSPVIIPVINVVDGKQQSSRQRAISTKPTVALTKEAKAQADQQRFQDMRKKLLK
ncbi:MAG: ribonuclease J [Patescibacteria group bacterium]|nr:ribonuclease J [Patescibacteria group bacterium]